jgi:hypothetical protein
LAKNSGKNKRKSQKSQKHRYRLMTAASTDVAWQTKADLASSAVAVLLVAKALRCGEQSREAGGGKTCKTKQC